MWTVRCKARVEVKAGEIGLEVLAGEGIDDTLLGETRDHPEDII